MTAEPLRHPPEHAQIVRDIACIRMHLEIAEISKRTQALMPSIVNFKDALARLTRLETAALRDPAAVALSPDDPEQVGHAIREGCKASDIHVSCTYPECTCTHIPRMVRAVIEALMRRNR